MLLPYATPLFDSAGKLKGAVNILIDVTDLPQVRELRAQAKKCKRLAQSIGDRQTTAHLLEMSAEYEARAVELAETAATTVEHAD